MAEFCGLFQSTENAELKVMLNEETIHLDEISEAKQDHQKWYLDTSASNHMMGNRERFTELDTSISGKVKFGDGSSVEICGRGNILFECRNGSHRALSNVYYIPQLKSSIISLGQLEQNACKIVLEKGHLLVYDQQGSLLAKVTRSKNCLYTLPLKLVEPVCLLSRMHNDAWLWHTRYGHLNFHALRNLASKGLVEGLPMIDHVDQICTGCHVGKQKRTPFPSEAVFRASSPLQLLHGDLCGPITPTTTGGNKYFLLLVDDYNKFMWLVLLKNNGKHCRKLTRSRLLLN